MARPRKSLSSRDLEEIEIMAGMGMRYEDIALAKDMSDDTLKKYAGKQLQRGKAKAKAAVMQTAYKMAMSGNHSDMTKFWLRTQCGWTEKSKTESVETIDSPNLTERIKDSDKPMRELIIFLAEIIDQINRGEMSPRKASSLAGLLRVLMKAEAQGKIEERLLFLESVVNNQSQPDELLLDQSLNTEIIEFIEKHEEDNS